jgi:Sulfotransferase family
MGTTSAVHPMTDRIQIPQGAPPDRTMVQTAFFTLLSQQRSGTHFLASMLSSHRAVQMYGEVLHRRSANSYFEFSRGPSGTGPSVDHTQPHEASWQSFVVHLCERNPDVLPGIVAMYNQLSQLPADIVSRIVDVPPVVHLVRQNVLRTHVSDFINRAKLKPPHTREEAPLSRILLPVDGLEKHLLVRRKTIQEFRERLVGRGHVEVYYEEVVQDPQGQTGRILRFLGLDPEPVRTTLKPSNPHPLSSILENFDEVRTALEGTDFAWTCRG